MGIWLSAGAVDVVILEVIAHFERIRSLHSWQINSVLQIGIRGAICKINPGGRDRKRMKEEEKVQSWRQYRMI